VEIREWIRSLGDRARLLVIIPLAAGSIAALITLVGPASYQASATLILPEDAQAGPITAVTAQRVADLTAAVRSEGVLDAVSRDTGVPRGDLDSITVGRSGSSGVIVVGFTSSHAEDVAIVAEAATRKAMATIAQARVDVAQAELDATIAGVDAAYAALIEEQENLGLTYSPDVLLILQRQAERLSNDVNVAIADQDLDAAALATEKLERKQSRINDMLQLQALYQRSQAAQQSVFAQQSVVFDAQGALSAAETLTVEPTRPIRVGKLQEAARRFVFVAAIGFLLALGLVILLQLMDRRRGEDTDDVDAGGGPLRRPAA